LGSPDRYDSAIAINDLGHAITESFPNIFLYTSGTATRLDLAPASPSHPSAINDCDVIVGSYGPYSDRARAFRWEKSAGFRNLNELIPASSGWTLEFATAVNENGVIVGTGDHDGVDGVGYLLTPAHP